MTDRDIQKVSLSGRRITISWQADSHREQEIKIYQEPHPDLVFHLNKLLPWAIELCHLDVAAWQEGKITGLTLKGGGWTATAQLPQEEGSPVVVNIPFQSKNDVSVIPIVNQILVEANAAIEGKSAQMSLDLK